MGAVVNIFMIITLGAKINYVLAPVWLLALAVVVKLKIFQLNDNKYYKISFLAIGIIVIILVSYSIMLFASKSSKKDDTAIEKPAIEKTIQKEIKVGDEFYLKNSRKLMVKEVKDGNYYMDNSINNGQMRAQVSVVINSDGGQLSEDDYSKMYILKGSQLIKLSNSKGAYW